MPKGIRINPDLQAEIVCTYVECGGNFTATEENLKSKGFEIGYGAIYNFVKRNPKATRLTDRFFTEQYEKAIYRRLGSVSASKIQEYLERAIEQIAQAGIEFFTEALKPEPNEKRLYALADCHKRLIDGAKQMAFVAQRFRDGIHAKAAPAVEQKFDNSQHKTDVLNIGEGGVSADQFKSAIDYIEKRKARQPNRITGVPITETSGNGDHS